MLFAIRLIFAAVIEVIASNIPIYWYNGVFFKSFYTHCFNTEFTQPSKGFYWCTDNPEDYVFTNILRWRRSLRIPKIPETFLNFAQSNKPLPRSLPHPNTLVYQRKRGRRFVVSYEQIA